MAVTREWGVVIQLNSGVSDNSHSDICNGYSIEEGRIGPVLVVRVLDCNGW